MPSASIVDVEGEVDVLTSPRLKVCPRGARRLGGSPLVVVNLDGVQYMDSTGLGVLVSALKRIREKNGNIVLTGLNPHLSKIFEITGLRKVFKVYPTEDAQALNDRLAVRTGVASRTAGTRDHDNISTPRGQRPEVSFRLRGTPSSVAKARERVVDFARAHRIPENQLFDIGLAVGEACANAVMHAVFVRLDLSSWRRRSCRTTSWSR